MIVADISSLRQDRNLELAISVLHVPEQIRQLTQSYLAVHEIAC
jgi:hypothetical protein